MLPRAPRTVLRAAKDDMPPYDGYEDEVAKRRISRDNVGVSFAKPTDIRTARLKQLLQDEDFAAAERQEPTGKQVARLWAEFGDQPLECAIAADEVMAARRRVPYHLRKRLDQS